MLYSSPGIRSYALAPTSPELTRSIGTPPGSAIKSIVFIYISYMAPSKVFHLNDLQAKYSI